MMPKRKIAFLILSAALAGCASSRAQAVGAAASQEAAANTEAPTDRKLFALLLRPGPVWKPGRPFTEQGLRPHFDYWMKLFREGRVATAGPLGSDSGLVILTASDQQDAEAIMRADPANTAGIFTGEVRPYAPPMINGDALPAKK